MATLGKSWRHLLSGKETPQEIEATIEMLEEYDAAMDIIRCKYALNLILDWLEEDIESSLDLTSDELSMAEKLIYYAVYESPQDEIVEFAEALVEESDDIAEC